MQSAGSYRPLSLSQRRHAPKSHVSFSHWSACISRARTGTAEAVMKACRDGVVARLHRLHEETELRLVDAAAP
jgi:hypothetical protein